MQAVSRVSSFSGQQLALRPVVARSAARPSVAVVRAAAATEEDERLRLNNLSPQPGSKKNTNRKGRGYGAGQGGTAGYGMRGQKSRSGSGIRPGFEGGQTPLYRRLPKLKGIAGGMGAGLPDYVVVNLSQLKAFADGETVSLEALEEKRIVNLSGRETRLPLKVLGNGDLSAKLTIKAAAFSASAKAKIEAAGGVAEELPQKVTWTRKAHEARVAAAAAK
ncbi:50S ribosomal chloroplastic [Micractinium conductrix]|uniref:50S ribosomal chloroplastic n=1 Tax=Micractinium conductrix TaxID=554055 RepID=A0A2P6VSD6_9CHLO|nr:50S ribosomal chloroplastic [Micractinium conductrix]|eukprot:PSC76987.1 50S ribosomal chloroplastic [Micractinium conductrix]